MRGRKYVISAILMSLALSLTGCGESFPDLTDEEYEQTVEFAVGLLMKYSNNGQEKLTYVDVAELKKQRGKEAKAAAKEAEAARNESESATKTNTAANTSKNTENTDKTSPTQSENSDTSADTMISSDITDNSSLDNSTGDEATSENTVENSNVFLITSEDSQEIGDDIFLSYQGYSVSSSYPESSKSYVINADKGKKLLVLRFDLYNAADSAQSVNILNKNILFQILLNGKNLGYTGVTMLPNDLSSYVGTIDSKAHESLVILTQIDESAATNIQTLGMIVTLGGVEQEVSLK